MPLLATLLPVGKKIPLFVKNQTQTTWPYIYFGCMSITVPYPYRLLLLSSIHRRRKLLGRTGHGQSTFCLLWGQRYRLFAVGHGYLSNQLFSVFDLRSLAGPLLSPVTYFLKC